MHTLKKKSEVLKFLKAAALSKYVKLKEAL
jgi:hypothetical protein